MFKKKRRNPFQLVCTYEKQVENKNPLTESTEVFEIKAQDKSRDIMKLIGVILLMQVNTRSDVTLIPRNFGERMG